MKALSKQFMSLMAQDQESKEEDLPIVGTIIAEAR